MSHVVKKPFRTVNRRFPVDAPVTPADIDGAVPFDVWKDRGFIAEHLNDQAPAEPLAKETSAETAAPARGRAR